MRFTSVSYTHLDVYKRQDVCCVTTRYFGGTLLGPGGLVRAYTAAAQAAVEAARAAGDIVEIDVYKRQATT